jgi:hypothetical protein
MDFYNEAKIVLIPNLFDIVKQYAKPSLLEVKKYFDSFIDNIPFKSASEKNITKGDIVSNGYNAYNKYYYVDKINKKSFSGFEIKVFKNTYSQIYDEELKLTILNFKNYNKKKRKNFKFHDNEQRSTIFKIITKKQCENDIFYFTSLTETGMKPQSILDKLLLNHTHLDVSGVAIPLYMLYGGYCDIINEQIHLIKKYNQLTNTKIHLNEEVPLYFQHTINNSKRILCQIKESCYL